jgi:hypothetical protein
VDAPAQAASPCGGPRYYFELRRSDDLRSALARVAEELHRQYIIGFTPSTLDGRTHDLRVEAKSSRLTVRARRTFFAATPTREERRP